MGAPFTQDTPKGELRLIVKFLHNLPYPNLRKYGSLVCFGWDGWDPDSGDWICLVFDVATLKGAHSKNL